MGRIKSKQIKRTSRELLEKSEKDFTENFEDNKKALGRILPSKKVRNKIAGYIGRLKRQKVTFIDDAENGNEQH